MRNDFEDVLVEQSLRPTPYLWPKRNTFNTSPREEYITLLDHNIFLWRSTVVVIKFF